ncbi:NUDIX hydrolase [Patescibacteria group bacterium]|nr:NUDIX hydrolase [Patescibacteria group bacterium]
MPTPDLKFAVLATDITIFTIQNGELRILLIPVHIPPFFQHMQGLPGGLIKPDETADDSALRHINGKTGLHITSIKQLSTFSAIKRDPRGRVVSVAYLAFVPEEQAKKVTLVEGATWVNALRLPRLAYDHNEIAKKALEVLRDELWYSNLKQSILPTKFTLSEMQSAFDVILHSTSDKRNFRKKVASLDIVKKVAGKKMDGAHRPAELYTFKTNR